MANQSTSRRAFLRTLTTAVGGTATLAAATMVQAAPIEPVKAADKTPQPTSAKGYQRTEHVNTYYQLADF